MEKSGIFFTYAAKSIKDTEQLAKRLAECLPSGTVVALDGELGAGKTSFSKLFAKYLGVKEMVNSPTFTLIKEYEAENIPFYHMDVYRISILEAEELGLDEYFFSEGITLVEWASKIVELLPEERVDIFIHKEGEQERNFDISVHGSLLQEALRPLKSMGEIEA